MAKFYAVLGIPAMYLQDLLLTISKGALSTRFGLDIKTLPVGMIFEVGGADQRPEDWISGGGGDFSQFDTSIHHPTSITTILMPLEIQCHDGYLCAELLLEKWPTGLLNFLN